MSIHSIKIFVLSLAILSISPASYAQRPSRIKKASEVGAHSNSKRRVRVSKTVEVLETAKREKLNTQASLMIGRATYLKDTDNTKFRDVGLSLESKAYEFAADFAPEILIGAELHQMSSEKKQNLYDFNLSFGPKFHASYFTMKLEGLAGVAFNEKSDTVTHSGGQVKFGACHDNLSLELFIARTQVISRFGLALGYSL